MGFDVKPVWTKEETVSKELSATNSNLKKKKIADQTYAVHRPRRVSSVCVCLAASENVFI